MLLLDSQTVLWVLDDSPRLGALARETITSVGRVYISAATVWELTMKAMLGKLSVPPAVSSRPAEQGLSLLSVTADHAEGIRAFPQLVRHDPIDGILVAQTSLA